MSTFSLSQTGTEINSAIGKVHNADTTPTQGSTNMVTSGGVHTAVNNIGASALPITTEAQGIANYDNDDKVPTNAAVKDYVDSNVPSLGIPTDFGESGTAATSGFLVFTLQGRSRTIGTQTRYYGGTCTATVDGASYSIKAQLGGVEFETMTIPIRAGATWSTTYTNTDNGYPAYNQRKFIALT
jgi:hypothetical protein